MGDAAGGILYSALMYLLLAFLRPSARSGGTAAASIGVCVAVELFQLTPYPARWGAVWPPLHLVLGSTFNPWDLIPYLAGTAVAATADLLLRRPGRAGRAGSGTGRHRPHR